MQVLHNPFFLVMSKMPKQRNKIEKKSTAAPPKNKVKFEVYGEEILEKAVKMSGHSGRVYLPPDWVGHKVKVIRVD